VTAVEEAAFSIALALDVFKRVMARGPSIDDFAPRASFLNAAGRDFFEEIAKFRAMRRMWARLLRETLGARDPRSWRLRVAVQNSGSSYTTQQPLNNIIRGTCSMLLAVLSGLQSLQVASYDEGLCLPTEESSIVSLRISQIIGYETGVTATVDPLAGSYFLETLTDQIEEEIAKLLSKIEELGGMLEATKIGWTEEKILESRVKNARRIESGEKIVVGVNKFTVDEEPKIRLHKIKTQEWERQRGKYLSSYRKGRDAAQLEKSLRKVSEGMLGTENMIPIITEALHAKATLGEICSTMRTALGFNIST
jgi:methylmalonyl-CoA mutase N-terminal domain/subunit